jgi:hypothetical protein
MTVRILRIIAIALCLSACFLAVSRWVRSPDRYDPATVVSVFVFVAAVSTLIWKLVRDSA